MPLLVNCLQLLRALSVAALALFVAGCGDSSSQVSNYPMLSKSVGSGPWQIVTYDDKLVMRETSTLDGDQVVARSNPVYVNNQSVFIYRDGTPIRSFTGETLYWNDQGYIINSKLAVIPEEMVFSVDGRPLANGTALKLRGYSKPSGFATINENRPLKAF